MNKNKTLRTTRMAAHRRREQAAIFERAKRIANIEAVTQAHTNINTWGAVLALCENSLFFGCHADEQRVVRICKAQMQKQLTLFDKAQARLLA